MAAQKTRQDALDALTAHKESYAKAKLKPSEDRTVLVIYTGGTFGCKMSEGSLAPMSGGEFYPVLKDRVPLLRNLGLECTPVPHEPAAEFTDSEEATKAADPAAKFKLFSFKETLDSTNMTPADWSRIARVVEFFKDAYDGFVVIQGTDTLYYTAAALTFMLAGTLKPVVVTGAQTPLIADVSDAVMNVTGAIRACIDVPDSTCAFKAPKTRPAEWPQQLVGTYLYFNFRLMNGPRCMKMDSHNYGAFVSPNMGFVAHAQPTIFTDQQPKGTTAWPQRAHVFDMQAVTVLHDQNVAIHEKRVKLIAGDPAKGDKSSDCGIAITQKMAAQVISLAADGEEHPVWYNGVFGNWLWCPGTKQDSVISIASLRLAPGMDSEHSIPHLQAYLMTCDGAIVEAYGAGNAQGRVQKMLEEVRNAGIPVAVITECNHSGVASDYAVAIPRECGALCLDMTPGCAYARMYLALFTMFRGVTIARNVDKASETVPQKRDPSIRNKVEAVMQSPLLLSFTPSDNEWLRNRLVASGV